MLRVEDAVRGRKCHCCGNKIEAGQSHLTYNSNSWYSQNACADCVKKLLKEIERANTYAKFITH